MNNAQRYYIREAEEMLSNIEDDDGLDDKAFVSVLDSLADIFASAAAAKREEMDSDDDDDDEL